MAAQVFYELLGFNARRSARRGCAQARAQRSAAARGRRRRARSRWRRTRRIRCRRRCSRRSAPTSTAHPGDVSTVHLGESPEEVEFLAHGTGPWRDLLDELGAWTDAWNAPGVSPVEYLADLGFLDSRVLVVHGVQFDGDDLARLRGARHDGGRRVRGATGTSASASAARGVLRDGRRRWRSAPTAWRASAI